MNRVDLLDVPWDARKHYRVCSAHFERYVYQTAEMEKLNRNAAPTIFQISNGDKLRNHLNKAINTRHASAAGQITKRNDDITNTDDICVKTEEAANKMAPIGINTIQTALMQT